jgi:hypothetical protein
MLGSLLEKAKSLLVECVEISPCDYLPLRCRNAPAAFLQLREYLIQATGFGGLSVCLLLHGVQQAPPRAKLLVCACTIQFRTLFQSPTSCEDLEKY